MTRSAAAGVCVENTRLHMHVLDGKYSSPYTVSTYVLISNIILPDSLIGIKNMEVRFPFHAVNYSWRRPIT